MTPGPIIAILAAGKASRFGGGKLDALCAGKPLAHWVLDAVSAAQAPPGLLIVGPEPPDFAQAALFDGWSIITNPAPEEGIGGSVRLAAAHAKCLGAEALILLLADMPLLDTASIEALRSGGVITEPLAARYPGGKPGVPARFPASMFGDLITLSGDNGAAKLLHGRADLHLLDLPENALCDVDDPAALERAERLLFG